MANKHKKSKIPNGIFKYHLSRKMPLCIETIQGSIPIYAVHDRVNMIETYQGCFTRSYNLTNINKKVQINERCKTCCKKENRAF